MIGLVNIKEVMPMLADVNLHAPIDMIQINDHIRILSNAMITSSREQCMFDPRLVCRFVGPQGSVGCDASPPRRHGGSRASHNGGALTSMPFVHAAISLMKPLTD